MINESMSSNNPSSRAYYETGHAGILLSASIEDIVAAVSTAEAVICELCGSRVEPTADSSTMS